MRGSTTRRRSHGGGYGAGPGGGFGGGGFGGFYSQPFAFADAERIFQAFFGGDPFARGGRFGGDPFTDPFGDDPFFHGMGGNVTVTRTVTGGDGTVRSSTTTYRTSSGQPVQQSVQRAPIAPGRRDSRHDSRLPAQAQRGAMLSPNKQRSDPVPTAPRQPQQPQPPQRRSGRTRGSDLDARPLDDARQEEADLAEAIRLSRREAGQPGMARGGGGYGGAGDAELDDDWALQEALKASLHVR